MKAIRRFKRGFVGLSVLTLLVVAALNTTESRAGGICGNLFSRIFHHQDTSDECCYVPCEEPKAISCACPFFEYGNWNGVYYYYAIDCGSANCDPVSASDSDQHDIAQGTDTSQSGQPCPNACNQAGTCNDPIVTGTSPPPMPAGSPTRKQFASHDVDNGKAMGKKDFHAQLNGRTDHPYATGSFKPKDNDVTVSNGPNLVVKRGQGKMHFFKTYRLTHDKAKDYTLFIAQEVKDDPGDTANAKVIAGSIRPSAPARMRELEITDGDHTGERYIAIKHKIGWN